MTVEPNGSTDVASDGLKPCPFCGKQPDSRWHSASAPGMDDCGYWGIDCCHAFAHEDSEAEAIAAWNSRIPASITADAVAGWKLVPVAALEWLNGEAPDPAGLWFGDFPDDHPQPAGAFWWRKQFADIISYYERTHPLGDAGDTEPGDLVEPDLWLCSAPAGVVSSGRSEASRENVQSYRDRGYTCEPYFSDASLSSLRAERDALKIACEQSDAETEMWAASSRQDELARKAAESSLAAEKQRADKFEMELANQYANVITAEQRVAALEGALTPFARLDMPAAEKWTCGTFLIEHSDIRSARAALRPAETGDGK